jgi:hypothetical protein
VVLARQYVRALEEIERLRGAEIVSLRDVVGRATALQREMDAEIGRLRVALQAMLETHGRPLPKIE